MRRGATHKNVRRRKSGGGDIYLEEKDLKSLGLGDRIQYSVYPIECRAAVMVKFRRARDE